MSQRETDRQTSTESTNPSDDVDELYVASSSHSGGCYHLDPECRSLRGPPKTRRPEIAASWYDACSWCVPEDWEVDDGE